MNIGSPLDARCALALAKVLKALDTNAADDLVLDAFLYARAAGYAAEQANIHDMPVMFQGEKILEDGWNEGAAECALSLELANCPECKRAHGDPCQIHG